eukprot:5010921-Amphidinium_carterae.1
MRLARWLLPKRLKSASSGAANAPCFKHVITQRLQPTYLVQSAQNGLFQCTVQVHDNTYVGAPAGNKKEAKHNAAAKAVESLQLLQDDAEGGSGTSGNA